MTKSKKRKDSLINKKELWNIFDQEIYPEKCDSLECVYRSCGNRENCDYCDNILAFSDEGFLTCTNCGTIYKDFLDQTAVWRYYGADDNQILHVVVCQLTLYYKNLLLDVKYYVMVQIVTK